MRELTKSLEFAASTPGVILSSSLVTLEAIINAGAFGALYRIENGDDPISEIIPTVGTFGNATQVTAEQRPTKITVDGIEVARTDHVDDNLNVPVTAASGGLIVGTPYGWMYSPQTWGSVDSEMPLVDTSFAAYTEELTDVQLDALGGLLGDRKYWIFQSPNTVLVDFLFYTGGPTTTIEFVGANGVTYSQDFSAYSSGNVDLGAQGLTAPVTVLVPQSALADLSASAGDYAIYLYNTNVTGALPDWSEWPLGGNFYFSDNSLTGSIPDWSGWSSGIDFAIDGNNLTGTIPDWSGWSFGQYVYLYKNSLTGSIPDWSGWSSADNIRLYMNNLTGTIPDWSGWSSGSYIWLYLNELTGTIPDWSGWSSGNDIQLDRNNLTDVAGTATPPGLTNLRLDGNALIEAAVDRVLTSLDTAGESNGTLDLSGGTNAAPSATGLAAKSNLEARGWYVTVNS